MNLQTVISNSTGYQVSDVQNDKEMVREIQLNLRRLGFSAGSPDGNWTKQTQEALLHFRAVHKLAGSDVTPQVARALLQPTPIAKKEPVAAGMVARSVSHPATPRPVPPPPPRRAAVDQSPQTIVSPKGTALAERPKVRINSAGLKIIKECEWLTLEAHLGAAGVPMIGYGSTVGVKLGQTITAEQAEVLLLQDIQRFEAAIDSVVKVALTSNQFSALVCFAFNVGGAAFRGSTLLKLLNQGDYQGAADQLLRWDKVGGKALPGLTYRRQTEHALFLQP